MIKEGTVVSLAYLLTNSEGEELDRAERAAPFSYLHGHSQIVPGLEKALVGLLVGAKKRVVVPPGEGYGEIDVRLRTIARRDQFPGDANLKVGMQFAAEIAPEEQVLFTVVDVKGDTIALDGNHPLAGETLTFDVEVIAVRVATPEELAHGHAHGAHGHAHDH